MKEIIFGIDCVLAALQSSRRKVFKMMVYDNKETQKRYHYAIALFNSC